MKKIWLISCLILFGLWCSKYEAPFEPSESEPEPKILSVTFSSDQEATQIMVYALSGMTVDMENPIAGPLIAPVETILPKGTFVTHGSKPGFQDQFIGFQVVPEIPTSIEFRLLPATQEIEEPDLNLFVTFTNALPDSILLEIWQNEWQGLAKPEVASTVEFQVNRHSLYKIVAFKQGEAYEQTILINETSAAFDFYLPLETVKFIIGSDRPGTALLRRVDTDDGEAFALGTDPIEKFVERGELYWVSFTSDDANYFAVSQLIVANTDQVIQPDWQQVPAPPDTVEIVRTVLDTVTVQDTLVVTLHDTLEITVRDTIVQQDTLVITERDTLIVTEIDTFIVTVRDTVVAHDTTIVINNFYRERLIDINIHGDVAILTQPGREIVERVFQTLFEGRIYIWGREVRGPDRQTDERYRIEVRRVATGELIGSDESPDTGSGETTRLMVVTSHVPNLTLVEVKWIAIGSSESANSIHFPETIAQNFAPDI